MNSADLQRALDNNINIYNANWDNVRPQIPGFELGPTIGQESIKSGIAIKSGYEISKDKGDYKYQVPDLREKMIGENDITHKDSDSKEKNNYVDEKGGKNESLTDEQKKKKMEEYKEHIKNRKGEEVEESYVTRGALLLCSCGTHSRRFDIRVDKGYRLNANDNSYPHPFMGESDCLIEQNIKMFGVCNGSNPPQSETVILVEDPRLMSEEDKEKNPKGKNVKGKKCTPIILGNWIQTKEDTLVDSGENFAVIKKSFLVCQYGGFIELYSTGEEYIGEEDSGDVTEVGVMRMGHQVK